MYFQTLIVIILIVALIALSLSPSLYSREFFNSRRQITIKKYVPAISKDTKQTKIPKVIIKTYSKNTTDEIFEECILSGYKLNPEYEHIFFNEEECITFITNNFSPEVIEAYNTIVPGAYKADLFRLCYLYINGGVYIDFNKTLKVPLREILDKDYDMFTVIDKGKCDIWQGFIACKPKMPFIKEAIEKCVKNIQNRYYGENNLDITGPRMLGKVFREYYNFCLRKPGVYKFGDETFKLAILRINLLDFDRGIYDENGKYLLSINSDKRIIMNSYWKYQTSLPHYSDMWKDHTVYIEEIVNKNE